MTLSGRLTQPVVVDDTVYVAETDTHTVHALSIAEGTRKWSFTGDGGVYCVRAMVLTQDKLVIAGPPDLRNKKDGILAYANEAEPWHPLPENVGPPSGSLMPQTVRHCPSMGWTPCRCLMA